MSKKPAIQRPVASPAVIAPKKMSARDRRALKNQPGDTLPLGNSPSVANAKRLLDSISESLAPDAATAIVVEAAAPAGTKRCAYHKVAEPVAAFSKNVTHSDGLNSSCRVAQKIQRAGRTKAQR